MATRGALRAVPAPEGRVGNHALAYAPARYACAERGDCAAEVGAEDMGEGQVQPLPAGPHEVIQPVQRGVAHLHQHFVRRGLRDGNVLTVFQHLRPAVVIKDNRTHGYASRLTHGVAQPHPGPKSAAQDSSANKSPQPGGGCQPSAAQPSR